MRLGALLGAGVMLATDTGFEVLTVRGRNTGTGPILGKLTEDLLTH